MTVSIKVSGQAEFSQIKREVKEIDRNLKGLQTSAQRGFSQGFLTKEQSRAAQFLMKEMQRGQERLNNLIDQEKNKVRELQDKYNTASQERKKHLSDELDRRKQILNTYEQEISAIKKRSSELGKDIGGMETGGGGGASPLSGVFGIGKKALALAGIAGVGAMISRGVSGAIEQQKYVSQLGMRVGGGSPDFQGLRRGIRDTGLQYGYTGMESMSLVDAYSSRAGAMTRGDQASLQAFSRSYGLDAGLTGGIMSEFTRTGASSTGEQKEFANMLAASINSGRMQERAVEAMETSAQLLGELSSRIPEVTGRSVIALQSLLNQTGNEGFRGERGADFMGQLGSMFTSSDNTTEFLTLRALGWGKDKSYYDARLQREHGLDNPENLASIMKYIQNTVPTPELQDLALTRLTGMSLNYAKSFREETGGYKDLSKDNIVNIQNSLENAGDVIEDRAAVWAESVGGWMTSVDAQLEEALIKFGNGMVVDLYMMKELTAEMVDTMGDFLKSDFNNGVLGDFLSPTTMGVAVGGLLLGGMGLGKLGAGLFTGIKGLFGGGAAAGGAVPGAAGGAASSSTLLPLAAIAATYYALFKGSESVVDSTTKLGKWSTYSDGAFNPSNDPRLQPGMGNQYTEAEKEMMQEIFGDMSSRTNTMSNSVIEDNKNMSQDVTKLHRTSTVEARDLWKDMNTVSTSSNKSMKGDITELKDKAIQEISGMRSDVVSRLGGVALLGSGGGINPFSGYKVTSSFGTRTHPITGQRGSFHSGTDYAMPVGTNVQSVGSGTVSSTGYDKSRGNYVYVKLDSGETTAYYHLDSAGVKKGDAVSAGQTLGKSGNTGSSTGPHLHFGVRDAAGNWIDPNSLLNSTGGSVGSYSGKQTLDVNVNVSGSKLDGTTREEVKKIVIAVFEDLKLKGLLTSPSQTVR